MELEQSRMCPLDSVNPLPDCRLAIPCVKPQKDARPQRQPQEALEQGTLFPELDLPFHLMLKGGNLSRTPETELQALEFVMAELGLYLDTHPGDRDAFQVFQQYGQLLEEGKRRFQAQYGPLCQTDAAKDSSYRWLCDPWPWNLKEG